MTEDVMYRKAATAVVEAIGALRRDFEDHASGEMPEQFRGVRSLAQAAARDRLNSLTNDELLDALELRLRRIAAGIA